MGLLMHQLYPWQAECLNQPGVAAGCNLVYSAPTSAGKSMVALVLLLQQLWAQPNKVVLMVMPINALCAEMSALLGRLLKPLGKEVLNNYAGMHGGAIREDTGVIVCTIERANLLVTRLLEEDPLLSCLGLVVVDELHMVGEQDRGYLLELLLTKLRYASRKARAKAKREAAEQLQQQRLHRNITLSLDSQDLRQQQQQGGEDEDEDDDEEDEQQQQQQQGPEGNQVQHDSRQQLGSNTSSNGSSSSQVVPPPQVLRIVGMSATLPNMDQVAAWLDAAVYVTDFRPVPLHQRIKDGAAIKDQHGQVVRALSVPPGWDTKRDDDHVGLLSKETVEEGHSVLVFVATKDRCLKEAQNIANLFTIPERSRPGAPAGAAAAAAAALKQPQAADDVEAQEEASEDIEMGSDEDEEAAAAAAAGGVRHAAAAGTAAAAAGLTRAEVARKLGLLASKAGSGSDILVLQQLVMAGAGFHHAGLPKGARLLVERAFMSGAISVLCATSTLAYGVNLPARRVIFKHAYKAFDAPQNRLTPTEYRQMSGRAGRAGIDSVGESILVVDRAGRNRQQLEALIQSGSCPVSSALVSSRRGMSRALLEVIAVGVVATAKDVEQYLKCSLLAATESSANQDTKAAVKWLQEHGMTRWDAASGTWSATPIGKAAAVAGLAPDLALAVEEDLHRCRIQGLVSETDLHPAYLATPMWGDLDNITVDWKKLDGMCKLAQRDLDGDDAREPNANNVVLARIGLLKKGAREYISKQAAVVTCRGIAAANAPQQLTPEQTKVDRVARRFWAARVLYDIIQEKSLDYVQQTWKVKIHAIQELRERANGFASMVAAFCERVADSSTAKVIKDFAARVYHGVKRDVVALTEIKGVRGPKARAMFAAGLRTPEDVAAVDVDRLLEIFLSTIKADPGSANVPEERIKKEKAAAANIIKAARAVVAHQARDLAAQGAALAAKAGSSAAAAAAAAVGVKVESRHRQLEPSAAVAIRSPDRAPLPAVAPAAAPPPPQYMAVEASSNGQGLWQQQQQQRCQQQLGRVQMVHQAQQQHLASPAAVRSITANTAAASSPRTPDAAVCPSSATALGRAAAAAARVSFAAGSSAAVRAAAAAAAGGFAQGDPFGYDNIVQQGRGPAAVPAASALAHSSAAAATAAVPAAAVPAATAGLIAAEARITSVGGVRQAEVQQQQQQQQQQPVLPPAARGIEIVKDPSSMQQLVSTLAALPSWGFAVNIDTTDATLNPNSVAAAVAAAAGRAGIRQSKGSSSDKQKKFSGGVGAGLAAGAAAAAAAAVGDSSADQKQQKWRWPVLGVAFSGADGGAWYVPLTTNAEQDDVAVRCGVTSRLQVMWAGVQEILGGGSSSRTSNDRGAVGTAVPEQQEQQQQPAEAGGAGSSSSERATFGRIAAVAAAAEWLPGNDAAAAAALAVDESAWLSGPGPGHQPVRVTYALKPQMMMLGEPPAASGLQGLVMADPLVDVRVAAWLLNPDSSKVIEGSWSGERGCRYLKAGLQTLLVRFGEQGAVVEAMTGLLQQDQPAALPTGVLEACQRAALAHKLYTTVMPDIKASHLLPLLMGIEMPLVRVLAAMEAQGIALSPAVMSAQIQQMAQLMEQLEKKAAEYNNGQPCPVMGYKLSHLLFGKEEGCLKLDPPPNAKRLESDRGYHTNAEVLEELKDLHPLPGILLKYRSLAKILEDARSRLNHAEQQQAAAAAAAGAGAVRGGSAAAGGADAGGVDLIRIRGQWMQTNTAAGRLAMEDPSMQCIPKPVDFQVQLSQAFPAAAEAAGGVVHQKQQRRLVQLQQHVNIRAAFEAPPGSVLLSADYNQIELRLMASMSKEPGLVAALSSGADPFQALAAQWLKKELQQVSDDDRTRAKRIAYGLIYGMGTGRLAAQLNIPEPEALGLSEDFRKSHPDLMDWIKKTKKDARENGYLRTLSGRRRLLPHIKSDNSDHRGHAERQAVNGVCQGSAADVVKGVMVELAGQLQARGLTQHCKLLLQIHDELVFEVADPHLPACAALIRATMEAAAGLWRLAVPLPVKLSVGPSWGELRPYDERAAV